MSKEKEDLGYWKNNAEEDYIKTPISVLRYITELEKPMNKRQKLPIQIVMRFFYEYRYLFYGAAIGYALVMIFRPILGYV